MKDFIIYKMDKIVFVDLDHTLITTISGKTFPIHSKDWKFIPDTINLLDRLKKDYKIAIVSNQAGIAHGFLTERVFVHKIEEVCTTLEKILKLKKNTIIYRFCKHKESFYRKPNPGMVYDILIEEELSIKDSIMIGDLDSDRILAENAGISNYINVLDIKDLDIPNA